MAPTTRTRQHGRTLQFHNFSWTGDPRWARTSRVTLFGPVVVVIILLLSIAEVALGSTWLVQLNGENSAGTIIVQTLLIPGCSFFNAIPSLHLHLLARSNPPKLAIWFSSIFCLVFLASYMLMLSSCTTKSPLPLRKAECYKGAPGVVDGGPEKSIWVGLGVCGMLSAVAYGVHAGMAWYVMRTLEKRRKAGVVEVEDPEDVEARNQKARELWIKMANREGL